VHSQEGAKSSLTELCESSKNESSNPLHEVFMARVTVEDCLEHVENRYELVHLTAKRVKQLREGDDSQVKSKNKEVVTALREIAAGKVKHTVKSEYDSDEF
jgi:DNA-directed RNA polymerase subunit omega